MRTRILNLLNLCLQAKEKGHHVAFVSDYYSVSIQHMVLENNEYKTVKRIDTFNNPDGLDEAEVYLKELI